MTLMAAGKQNSVSLELANGVRWPFVLLCCTPLIGLRIWILLMRPQMYDFITYWAAGHLFLTGGQPYSQAAMEATEKLHGWQHARPLVLLCPPWALPMVAVMATLPFRIAQTGWFFISLALNCFSAIGLWHYFGGEMRKVWIALLLMATFVPMGWAELLGQITPLSLASLTGFLLLLRSERYVAAGATLLGLGAKPHLLYLVLLALVVWSVERRKWNLLVGFLASYGTATIAALLFNPSARDYFRDDYGAAIETPCGAGGVLRSLLGAQHVWLQFVPSLFGAAWFLYYWFKNHRHWEWQRHLPLLLVVSVSTAPYYWFHDFILILPALIALAVRQAYRSFHTLVIYLALQVFIDWAGLPKVWSAGVSILWIVFYCVANAELTTGENDKGQRSPRLTPSWEQSGVHQ